MSFGWSAGDIAFALQILYKVGSALKEAGGASSAYEETTIFLDSLQKMLEHMRIFSSTTFDADKIDELRNLVAQLRGAVTRCQEIRTGARCDEQEGESSECTTKGTMGTANANEIEEVSE